MLNNLNVVVAQNSDIKAQIEESLKEGYANNNIARPCNFDDIVNILTAMAVEYGTKIDGINSANQINFTLNDTTKGLLFDSIFNYGLSNDPFPKALAKAIVAASYNLVDELARTEPEDTEKIAICFGPNYELTKSLDENGTTISDIAVDYTLTNELMR